jgi:hypothetical protein
VKLKLTREVFTEKSTKGRLSIDGEQECYLLEDKDRRLEDGGVKVYGATAIPRGTFQVVLDFSSRFQQVTPRLVDVPQFSSIRIHAGNAAEDTEGCLLPGYDISQPDFIGKSMVAYDALMLKLMAAEERSEPITIEVA